MCNPAHYPWIVVVELLLRPREPWMLSHYHMIGVKEVWLADHLLINLTCKLFIHSQYWDNWESDTNTPGMVHRRNWNKFRFNNVGKLFERLLCFLVHAQTPVCASCMRSARVVSLHWCSPADIFPSSHVNQGNKLLQDDRQHCRFSTWAGGGGGGSGGGDKGPLTCHQVWCD